MSDSDLKDILMRLARGNISIDQAEHLMKVNAIAEVKNLARLDTRREIRRGIPEIILAEGKEPDDLIQIVKEMLNKSGRVIISRIQDQHLRVLKRSLHDKVSLEIDSRAGMVVVKKKSFKMKMLGGRVGIITAGTSDIAVAREVSIVSFEMGCEVYPVYDVGVAGLHRIFDPLKNLIKKDVDVLVVVAGREGALPSVVAGLVDVPVIGVPTSTGYGFGGNGIASLMAMLQACPLGLTVVNIDAGVAGGVAAALIANKVARSRRRPIRGQSP